MSNHTRRDFLKLSAAISGTSALGWFIQGCSKNNTDSTKWQGFKYAMCNESMQELPWEKQCEIVAEAGYKGIEIASFTLVKQGVQELASDFRKGLLNVIQY